MMSNAKHTVMQAVTNKNAWSLVRAVAINLDFAWQEKTKQMILYVALRERL